jgi:hypothetical protein
MTEMIERVADERWILEEASKPSGFMPNAESVGKHCRRMVISGLLAESARMPIFHITDAGRAALTEREKSE